MIAVYFGSPGSGKTTLACREILRAKKHYRATFANFGCKCADFDDVDLKDLGQWTFPAGSYVAIDEAGIEYNNRKYKSLSQDTIKWFKLHRHYGCDLSIWSQSWDDMDVTLRRLADRLYYVKRIGPFSILRRVYKRVKIDKETEQIIDGYKMVHMLFLLLKPLYYASFAVLGLGFLIRAIFPQFDEIRLILRLPYYKYFDTHAAPPLEVRFAVPDKPSSSNRIQGMRRSCAALLRRIFSKGVKTPTKVSSCDDI